MHFRKNIGTLDMVLRIGLSAAAIYAGFIDTDIINDALSSVVVGIIGALNLVVALIRFCPLYAVAGINTNAID
ncbi:hypothetical protein MNBD_GAMMA14-2141 [hydrothermal vent metagenome]|uniref:Inner membrane protein YgaP-like transmembrane domain-containing protein n=1 Tax=hydrothermal vent metagenome TaxID=652676 RepID=A0A3B0Z148_9ZZZZ